MITVRTETDETFNVTVPDGVAADAEFQVALNTAAKEDEIDIFLLWSLCVEPLVPGPPK